MNEETKKDLIMEVDDMWDESVALRAMVEKFCDAVNILRNKILNNGVATIREFDIQEEDMSKLETFKVEKGIPIPDIDRSYQQKWVFPFDKMQVGNSFVIALDSSDKKEFKKALVRAKNAVYKHAKLANVTVTSRVITEDKISGLRVWRTK